MFGTSSIIPEKAFLFVSYFAICDNLMCVRCSCQFLMQYQNAEGCLSAEVCVL